MRTLADLNAQIAGAAEEQSQVVAEVSRNTESIQQVAEESAAGAGQTAASGTELARLGEQLRGLVGQFRV